MRWPRNKRRGHASRVSATQLAQMGVCEKLVVFEYRHGKRPSQAQRVALERGLRAHRHFLRQASPTTAGLADVVLEAIIRLAVAASRRFMRWWLTLRRRL